MMSLEKERVPVYHRPKVGVGVFILSDRHPGCVVVGERKGILGEGLYQLPGGHLEFGESWSECAHREVLEECGVELADIAVCGVVNAVNLDNDYHYVDIVMKGFICGGAEPTNMEPDKCIGWKWVEFSSLDANDATLFWPFRTLLRAGCSPYAPFTWDNVDGKAAIK